MSGDGWPHTFDGMAREILPSNPTPMSEREVQRVRDMLGTTAADDRPRRTRAVYVCPPVWLIPGLAASYYEPSARERAERSLAVASKLQEMGVATPELSAAVMKLRNAMGGGR